MDIKRINLNLLVHFNTLLKERSVSRAAQRSFISQTAMSHILKQLRDLFDDNLFVRKSNGLRPTKKALELEPKIKEFIASANGVFEEDIFDPNVQRTSLKAAFANFGEHVILSRLSVYLKKYAPHTSLTVIPLSAYQSLDTLLENEIDFAIAPQFIKTSSNVITKKLSEERPVCVFRKEHPLATKNISKEDFMEADHIDIKFSEAGSSFLNEYFDFYSSRCIRLTVPNVISGLEVIEKLDYMMCIPLSLANSLQGRYNFVIKDFPTDDTYLINALYHKRMLNYTPLMWIIDIIATHCLGSDANSENNEQASN